MLCTLGLRRWSVGVVKMSIRRTSVVVIAGALFGCSGPEPVSEVPTDSTTQAASIATRPVETAAAIAFTEGPTVDADGPV